MKVFLIAVLMMQAVSVLAQTEVPDTGATASMLKMPEMVPQMSYSTTETLLPYASSSAPKPTRYVPTMDMSIPAYRPPGVFGLWKGAVLGVTGSQSALPGLMDISSGALTFHQDYCFSCGEKWKADEYKGGKKRRSCFGQRGTAHCQPDAKMDSWKTKR